MILAKTAVLGENPVAVRFVHHKSDTEWPGIERVILRGWWRAMTISLSPVTVQAISLAGSCKLMLS